MNVDPQVASELEEEQLNEDVFYQNAKNYWSKIPATVNGVLGGFGHISKCDIESSESFLRSLFQSSVAPGRDRALDCGAGIGRITKHLLTKFFKKVDLVEQNESFLHKARQYIGPTENVGNLYCVGLQNFKPKEKYDVVWCQWVLGHLTDEDLILFMRNCQECLAENGVIVVKENVTSSGETEMDATDSSVTRGFESLLKLLQASNLSVEKLENQTKFPKGLYPVKMIALRKQKINT